MHVCFLNLPIEYYSPVTGGAISTIIAQCSQAMLQRGHQVTVLTRTSSEGSYQIGDVKEFKLPARDQMSWLRRKLSGLRGRFAGWDWPGYDFYLGASLHLLKSLKQPADATIVFNDLVTQKYLRRSQLSGQIYCWLQNEWRTNQRSLHETLEATDAFLCCSRYIANWTSQTHGIAPIRFRVVPSGVDLESFRPCSRRSNSGGNELRVLFVGRIDSNKGPDIAADAVGLLQREGKRISLTVAGGLWFYGHGQEMEDPYFRKLKEKMDQVGAHYLGHVERERLPSIFREHDVVCVLSRSQEPFGLVVLEAMASGCAVIASDRGGLPEACGGVAKLVNPDDLSQVVAALRVFIESPEHLQAAKTKSLERASRASWNHTAELLEGVLNESRI